MIRVRFPLLAPNLSFAAERAIMKTITRYEVLEMLDQDLFYEPLRFAKEQDYDCYYLSGRGYKQDQNDRVFLIGYTEEVYLEGKQFIKVCEIKQGKISYLGCNASDFKRFPKLLELFYKNSIEEIIIIA
jgi:hypothetical protein